MPGYFPAACRFSEYSAFALENIERAQRSRVSRTGRFVVYLSALAAYSVKSLKIRDAQVAIDAAGIRRAQDTGTRGILADKAAELEARKADP